jgi:hypothetical protein
MFATPASIVTLLTRLFPPPSREACKIVVRSQDEIGRGHPHLAIVSRLSAELAGFARCISDIASCYTLLESSQPGSLPYDIRSAIDTLGLATIPFCVA